jgi:dihydrofolate synthase/folylpolyglutamate synthase
MSLDTVRALDQLLGKPHQRFPTIHVAGTKGKGSTCAFTASILAAAGWRVGMYTSPHLQDVRERIAINSVEQGSTPIPETDFARLIAAAKPAIEEFRHPAKGQRRATYFEVLTHLAFAYFAEQKVDCAVIEVGLGGRLDATNIISPSVCAITSISFDHTAMLGNTLAEIAREKAGILKPNVPVVVAPQHPDAMAAILDQAEKIGSPVERIGIEIPFKADAIAGVNGDWPLPSASVTLPGSPLKNVHSAENLAETPGSRGVSARCPGVFQRAAGREFSARVGLHGAHQVENWAVAVRLADRVFTQHRGARLECSQVESGSRNVVWPGRLEELAVPHGGTTRVVLDGAHNDYSLNVVCQELLSRSWSRPFVVLFGCARDKDHLSMLRVLAEAGPEAVLFTHSGNPRGRDPSELAQAWSDLNQRPAQVVPNSSDALADAVRRAEGRGAVLVAGSLYLVGAIKDLVGGKQ